MPGPHPHRVTVTEASTLALLTGADPALGTPGAVRTPQAVPAPQAAGTPGAGAGRPPAWPGARPVDHRGRPASDELIGFHEWTHPADWRHGRHGGTRALPTYGGLVIDRPMGTVDVTDVHGGGTRSWEYATWTSPVTSVGFDATELVASWNADTPTGTWLQVEVQATYSTGARTPWYVLGRWASGDGDIHRATQDGQGDYWSTVRTDTLVVDDANRGVLLRAYRLRVTLYRAAGQRRSPRLRLLGAMTSRLPARFTVPPSAGGIAWGTELPVPRLSQMAHRGHYPQWGGGGQVWCSPTSTTMVLEYWGRYPSAADLAWVAPGHRDPQVAHAARMTWDYQYAGAGNWPFNTAYAASYPGIEARVTRLSSLDDVERFIGAGIPVITSQSFLAGELDGSHYGTAGHLFVVVGFTADGDVVVNDPASDSNAEVRHVYRRKQFEQVWLRTRRINASGGVSSGSGGIAYLIKPHWKPWPTPGPAGR